MLDTQEDIMIEDEHSPVQLLTLELTAPTLSDAQTVYITGNFNDWKTKDDNYKMVLLDSGIFQFTFPEDIDLPKVIEYKYTLGGWENVEIDKYGNKKPNRKLTRHTGTIHDKVAKWLYSGTPYRKPLLPTIELVAEDFAIPQLKKTRRIWALLPHDYATSGKSYPVLYLHDGQNLFNPKAPFGNWAIDKKMAILAGMGKGDLIIVTIDHAGKERIKEFNPFRTGTKLGWGVGRKYVEFMADTLKPYIDQKYRTLTSQAHTGIGGSSMGGLISIFAGLERPEVFGKLLIFSPSLWVSQKIYFNAINFNHFHHLKIYLYAGGAESESMVPNVERLRQQLQNPKTKLSSVSFKMVIDPKGKHSEYYWNVEFPKAVDWLFF